MKRNYQSEYTGQLLQEKVNGVLILEEFTYVKGLKGLYEVSNFGRIYSLKRKVFKTPTIDKGGYPRIMLYGPKKRTNSRLHRIVCENFYPQPKDKKEVNHKFGEKLDCRAWNLEWSSRSDNMKHAWRTGLRK